MKVSGSPDKEIKAWELFESYLKKYTANREFYELYLSTMKVDHAIFKHDISLNPNSVKVTNFDGLYNVLKPLNATQMKKKSSVCLDAE